MVIFTLAAGALDVDAGEGAKPNAESLGIAPDRAYGTGRRMLAARKNRLTAWSLVTVRTPNSHPFRRSTKASLKAGFKCWCERAR